MLPHSKSIYLRRLKKGGIVIANTAGFDSKNLKLANYPPDAQSPLEDGTLDEFRVYKVDVSRLTKEALKDYAALSMKEIERSKKHVCVRPALLDV